MRRGRFWVIPIGGILAVYSIAAGVLFTLMLQPPERFARAVARLPQPLIFAALPFETLWKVARSGALSVGEAAPDFDLHTADRRARVRLSTFRGRMPVVLVFGSYT